GRTCTARPPRTDKTDPRRKFPPRRSPELQLPVTTRARKAQNWSSALRWQASRRARAASPSSTSDGSRGWSAAPAAHHLKSFTVAIEKRDNTREPKKGNGKKVSFTMTQKKPL